MQGICGRGHSGQVFHLLAVDFGPHTATIIVGFEHPSFQLICVSREEHVLTGTPDCHQHQ